MTDEPELTQLADGVHAWIQPNGSWWVNNAGAVVGADGVVLVDTCATRVRTERFLDAVGTVSGGAPIRIAVNTHLHGDHTHGNALVPESAVIIGHEHTREGMLAEGVRTANMPIWSPKPDWGGMPVRPPTVVVRDGLTLFEAGHRIELHHPGYTAHTRGDLIVWLPHERVLFSGDLLFHGVTPLIAMGSVEGALRSLDWLAGFGAETIVPGHGAVLREAELPELLATIERYYRFVAEVARRGIADGLTPLQAADCELGEFATLPDVERIVLNLHRAYADATGKPYDSAAAFQDAVTWHGGPLRCIA